MSPAALRKAAVLVASLDADEAERVLDLLGPDQARLVRDALLRLDDIDADEQREVIAEFLGGNAPKQPLAEPDDGIVLAGSLTDLERQYDIAPPEELQPLPVPERLAAPFNFLREAAPRELTPLVAQEHPQTIALVVSHLSPERAAAILTQLSSDVQAQVIARLVELDEAHPEIVREVERGLETRFSAHTNRQQRRSAGLAAVSRILDAADPHVADHIVANLHHFAPELAEELAPPQFEFADVERLDDARLGLLISAVDPELLILAMAGATEAFSRRVLGLLPGHEAKLLARQLERLAPTRLSDLFAAQQELADCAMQLRAEGRLQLDVLPRSLAA